MDFNALYYGDCLTWMRKWQDESVDLIYLDPPFNSKSYYDILYSTETGSTAQMRAFSDTWRWDRVSAERVQRLLDSSADPAHVVVRQLHGLLGGSGMLAYLSYMAERLSEMRRLLRPTGSIYLHCDPTASHYLKIVMDNLFGAKNFRNEIIWRIGWVSGYKTQKSGWIRNHDTILYYLKSSEAKERFNKEFIPYPEGYVRRDGNAPKGKGIPIEDTWNCQEGDTLNSIMIMSFSKEKLGYDTQKPIALLKRIITASSREGDVVLDPFCGCGTTIDAARTLKRRWIGIDISAFAIDLIRKRRFKDMSIPAFGIPSDLASARALAREKPFDFETFGYETFGFEIWAISRIAGMAPNEVQVGDGGIDGRGQFIDEQDERRLVLVQVKGGSFSLSHLRDFLHVVHREEAVLGVYITIDSVSSPAAITEVAKQGKVKFRGVEYPRIQLWSIADYFERKKPALPAMLDPFTGKNLHSDMFVDEF